jgi:two-component system sensor histidine kinase QseC
MMRLSIQARLLGASLLSVLIVAMVTLWLAYREAGHEVEELLDGQLVQYARIMLALAHAGEDDEVEPAHIDGHRYASKVIFQIWERTGAGDRLLLRSPEAPGAWPAGVARNGFSELRLGASHWRCFAAVEPEGKHYVLAALDLAIHDELTHDIAWGNLRPYLYSLPFLALLLAWGVRNGLAPLRRLDVELAGRSPGRLDPLTEAHATRELRPLIQTMNRLFGRLTQALDNERRFTSDAAHELRTPLAAMKLQLQVAERCQDADEAGRAIGKALRGADRMSHLVAQLLALARLESGQQMALQASVGLSELVRDSIDEAEALAGRKAISLTSEIDPDLVVNCNSDLLRVLMRNLLDNAIRYGQAGGHVRIILKRQAQHALISVLDDGPGVPAADRGQLGQRFQRFGAHAVDGVGLGLSIVRRIAELHGAELQFGIGLDGHGFGVTVSLPADGA